MYSHYTKTLLVNVFLSCCFVSYCQLENIPFDLPLIVINTDGEQIPNEPKIDVSLGIVNNPSGINHYGDTFTDYNGKAGIEIRGNGSSQWAKKSYQFETRKENGDNNNVSLLGLSEENDWILYGVYLDPSGMRNVLTYDLAREMGYYASNTVYCELILDGVYQGLYVLTEMIKRDKNRVDITKFDSESNPDEGGYIFKIDSKWSSDNGWQTDVLYEDADSEYWPRYQYVYPKSDDITYDQKEFIKDYMHSVDQAIWDIKSIGADYVFDDIIDINSFIHLFIVNELSLNPDGYRRSTYMSYDPSTPNAKLTLGPVWDYNVCYGNYYERFDDYYDGWDYDNTWWDINGRIPFWWKLLMEEEEFVSRLISRWRELRQNVITTNNISTKIDLLNDRIGNAMLRDREAWPKDIVRMDIEWASTESYADNVEGLKSWIAKRIDWIDNQFDMILNDSDFRSATLYPNPSGSNVYIDMYTASDKALINMYDMTGRLVITRSFPVYFGLNQLLLDDLNMGPGGYIIEIISGDRIEHHKFIKH